MRSVLSVSFISVCAVLSVSAVAQQTASTSGDSVQQDLRGLDAQVQEIKSDVLSIAQDLSLLEERLLYPSGTHVAVFVAMDAADAFRLDAVRVEIDGELATHYIYSFKELEALQNGGVQRVYTGNVAVGSHDLTISVNGKLQNGRDFETSETFSFDKDVDPRLLGLTLSAAGGGAAIEFGVW